MCPVSQIQQYIEACRVAVGSGGPFPPTAAEFPFLQLLQFVYPFSSQYTFGLFLLFWQL